MSSRALSRGRILDAALELVDEQGIGALSMRKLAARLGVEAMSLYNHVASKADLLDGIAARVFEEIALPDLELPWDRRLRELTDARNALDTAAYQVERMVTDRGDAVPVHEKARAEQLVADGRAALGEQAPLERVRPLTSDLEQLVQALPAAASANAGAGPAGEGAGDGSGRSAPKSGDDDEVVDVDFTHE